MLKLERETGFEPATSTLARSHSTTELFPLAPERLPYHTVGVSGKVLRRVPYNLTALSTRVASSGEVGLM